MKVMYLLVIFEEYSTQVHTIWIHSIADALYGPSRVTRGALVVHQHSFAPPVSTQQNCSVQKDCCVPLMWCLYENITMILCVTVCDQRILRTGLMRRSCLPNLLSLSLSLSLSLFLSLSLSLSFCLPYILFFFLHNVGCMRLVSTVLDLIIFSQPCTADSCTISQSCTADSCNIPQSCTADSCTISRSWTADSCTISQSCTADSCTIS